MDHFLLPCITVIVLILNAESQTLGQKQYPNGIIINPDVIYFADNRPTLGKNINYEVNQPSVDLQSPTNFPNVVQQQPVYDPNWVQQRTSGEASSNNVENKIRVDQTAGALTNFSLALMRNVNEHSSRNVVVSPYSIATLLSLLQQGATDQSLEQISEALQMTAKMSAIAYKAFSQDLQSRDSRNILKSANNIFLAAAFSQTPEFTNFRTIAQKDFSSDITPTVFERSEQAAQSINDWVAAKTNNEINQLISAESLPTNTQMVLVNTMYFKGLWEIPFRAQSTKPDVFVTSSGAKTVPFMATRRYFRSGIDNMTGSRVIVLPFERDEYSLMIIVPSTLMKIDYIFRSLTVSQLEDYLNLRPIEVMLRLPKFTIRADTDLTPVLKGMGITQIFKQQSNLSGLGSFRTYTPQVSSAVHSAVLKIDEEGATAAAASAFAVVALSNDEPSMKLKVDRPFIAVLWDGNTKIPLFMAKIVDPSL